MHGAAAMDRDNLQLEVDSLRYQATMERWPVSRSITEYVIFLTNTKCGFFFGHFPLTQSAELSKTKTGNNQCVIHTSKA